MNLLWVNIKIYALRLMGLDVHVQVGKGFYLPVGLHAWSVTRSGSYCGAIRFVPQKDAGSIHACLTHVRMRAGASTHVRVRACESVIARTLFRERTY